MCKNLAYPRLSTHSVHSSAKSSRNTHKPVLQFQHHNSHSSQKSAGYSLMLRSQFLAAAILVLYTNKNKARFFQVTYNNHSTFIIKDSKTPTHFPHFISIVRTFIFSHFLTLHFFSSPKCQKCNLKEVQKQHTTTCCIIKSMR